MWCLLLLASLAMASCHDFETLYTWYTVDFNFPNDSVKTELLSKGEYIPENNMPLGMHVWEDKIFITIPRWKQGVVANLNVFSKDDKSRPGAASSSLSLHDSHYQCTGSPTINYFDGYTPNLPTYTPQEFGGEYPGVRERICLKSGEDYFGKWKSPTLTPYPNWEANDVNTPGSIVSAFRVRSDACGRLWGVDTGIDDILGNTTVVDRPRLFAIDLKTDEILRSYPLKDSDQTANSFFADLVVDSDANDCENTHVYISDLGGYGLVVYSWAKNDSWRVSHNYFHFDPLHGNFNVSGFNFQWTDGVFGLSLSPKGSDGHRTLYFHAMCGITEFSVSTEVLQDYKSKKYEDYYAFKIEGNKGPNTQGPSSVIDQTTGINYLTQVSKNGVACWDTSVALNPDTLIHVAQDNTTLVFPNDISIDEAQNKLYVLSDNLPQLVFSYFDTKKRNFFITAAPLDKLTASCKMGK